MNFGSIQSCLCSIKKKLTFSIRDHRLNNIVVVDISQMTLVLAANIFLFVTDILFFLVVVEMKSIETQSHLIAKVIEDG